MSLIIDGYNLIHAGGILGRGVGPGSLERARRALLNLLVESLDATEIRRTIVVFDASDPSIVGARRQRHRGLDVRFARGHKDADALIEELIAASSAPRRLTVVSSDHRLHRAARKRRARAVDSDAWLRELYARRHAASQDARHERKPSPPLTETEVEHWLKVFADDDIAADMAASPPKQPEPQEPRAPDRAKDSADDDIFPPGYAEDVFDEER